MGHKTSKMLGCSNLAETDAETAPDLSAGGSGNSVAVQMICGNY